MTSKLINATGMMQEGTADARIPPGGDHHTSGSNRWLHRGSWGTTYALDPWRAVHNRLRREWGPASAHPCAAAGAISVGGSGR